MIILRILFYFVLVLFLVNFVNAATIYGTIYDLSLKKVDNARVEISTIPKQFLIAQNGSYSFNAPNGAYTIKAQLIQRNVVLASVQENITIKQDGSYVLDLILFPDIEEGVEEIDVELNDEIIDLEKGKDNFIVYVISSIIIAAALIGIYFYYIKNKKQIKEEKIETKAEEKHEGAGEDNNLNQLMKIIKQERGRTTQKEIRKQIPLSEAKISLMIAELEHKGVVEKIKKGRGNIIILKKK